MLFLILYNSYIYLGKNLHHVLLPFLRFGKEKRVRVVVLTDDQHILLIRNWFGHQNWSLPGGGVRKGEAAKGAIVRELHEETGLSVKLDRVNYLKPYVCRESSAPFEADVYYTIVSKRPRLSKQKSLEVIERRWHSLEKLPKDLAMPIAGILKEIKSER